MTTKPNDWPGRHKEYGSMNWAYVEALERRYRIAIKALRSFERPSLDYNCDAKTRAYNDAKARSATIAEDALAQCPPLPGEVT